MWVCNHNHSPVAYTSIDCPVCELTDELKDLSVENDKLRDTIEGLEYSIDDNGEKIAKLEDKIDELYHLHQEVNDR